MLWVAIDLILTGLMFKGLKAQLIPVPEFALNSPKDMVFTPL